MTKIRIFKIEYVNDYPDDDQCDPELRIKVRLKDNSIVELHTPNGNRAESLVRGGFFKEGKTIDVPIKRLSDGRIFIDEKSEIRIAEELYQKSIKKAKGTFKKIGIEKIDE